MLHPIVAHPTSSHLALRNSILNRPPALQPFRLPAIRTMQQVQIQMPQPALLYTLLYLLSRRIVARIRLQFGGEPYVFSFELRVLLQVCEDGGADFLFVLVPLCGVDTPVAGR